MGKDKEHIKTGVSSENGALVTPLEKVTKIKLQNVIVRVNTVKTFQSIFVKVFFWQKLSISKPCPGKIYPCSILDVDRIFQVSISVVDIFLHIFLYNYCCVFVRSMKFHRIWYLIALVLEYYPHICLFFIYLFCANYYQLIVNII